MWFQAWLLDPVRKAMSGSLMGATLLNTLYSELNDLEHILSLQLDQRIKVDDRRMPMLKRVLLYQKRHVSEIQEDLRSKTANPEMRKTIDAQAEPVDRLMSQEWFIKGRELAIPSLTEFLNLQAAYQGLPEEVRAIELKYDEKFRILQSQAEFLPRLRQCRIESWLRGTDISVAFIDIDNFKRFNTKYTESIVDRDLLPRLMQTLEAQSYFRGWAYRFGGDEYLTLLPNMPFDSALAFLRELQRKLGSMDLPGIEEQITVSIGLCTVSADSILTELQVQEKANKAKEFAKNAGKNCIATFRGELFLENDLYSIKMGQ
jgi:diguanylate cyclase (GGDEF)-like protein